MRILYPMLGTVVETHSAAECVTVKVQNPELIREMVPVAQSLLLILGLGLPKPGDTVIVTPVNNGAAWVVTDKISDVAVEAARRGSQAYNRKDVRDKVLASKAARAEQPEEAEHGAD